MNSSIHNTDKTHCAIINRKLRDSLII